MNLFTAQYRYSGQGRLDITVKGKDPLGKYFAPTWAMVKEHKRTNNDQQYIEDYNQMMRNSYIKNPQIWEEVLSRDLVVLVCFCPVESFCHRFLLANMLINLGANYKGEIKSW